MEKGFLGVQFLFNLIPGKEDISAFNPYQKIFAFFHGQGSGNIPFCPNPTSPQSLEPFFFFVLSPFQKKFSCDRDNSILIMHLS